MSKVKVTEDVKTRNVVPVEVVETPRVTYSFKGDGAVFEEYKKGFLICIPDIEYHEKEGIIYFLEDVIKRLKGSPKHIVSMTTFSLYDKDPYDVPTDKID
jgi:hypothetical protein